MCGQIILWDTYTDDTTWYVRTNTKYVDIYGTDKETAAREVWFPGIDKSVEALYSTHYIIFTCHDILI